MLPIQEGAFMLKKYMFNAVFTVLSAIFAASLCAGGKAETVPAGKIPVAATFDAMSELVKIAGQDKVYVRTVIPAGMEAHDFEPKTGDLKFLGQAKVVVSNGLGMEPWLENAVKAVNNRQLLSICASDGITPIKLTEEHHHHDEHGHEECDCGEDHHGHHHHHHHGDQDPHAWLSLESAKIMVNNIAAGLAKVDPANASFYEKNASAFSSEADTLLAQYREAFAQAPNKHFVTGHAAFGYLCRDFGLEQNSVEDVFSSGEPSAKQLANLTDYCNQYGIKTVFTETMASPQVSKTLAKEVGASVEVIYTMENAEDGLSYMERMKSNIEKIYKSVLK